MGPREALAQIMAMVKLGQSTNDVAEVHAVLREMEAVIHLAMSRRNVKRARTLLSLRHR
jgi:hypothetical protein